MEQDKIRTMYTGQMSGQEVRSFLLFLGMPFGQDVVVQYDNFAMMEGRFKNSIYLKLSDGYLYTTAKAHMVLKILLHV